MSLKVRTDIFQTSSMKMEAANIQEYAETFCVKKMAKQKRKRKEEAPFNARQILLDMEIAERKARLEVLEMVGYEEPKKCDETEPTKQDIISRLKAERRQRNQHRPVTAGWEGAVLGELLTEMQGRLEA
jgi:hypothetical protein